MAGLEELRRLTEAAGVSDVTVRTPSSFVDFCSLVAAARGVISVDTATAHLATALDKPAAIILGGGQYGDFGPWRRSPRQVWFTHQVPCFGCLWSCIHPEPLCITQVPPSEVAAGLVQRI
jgi:ADP-heptose:LPS heptosyltransferase